MDYKAGANNVAGVPSGGYFAEGEIRNHPGAATLMEVPPTLEQLCQQIGEATSGLEGMVQQTANAWRAVLYGPGADVPEQPRDRVEPAPADRLAYLQWRIRDVVRAANDLAGICSEIRARA